MGVLRFVTCGSVDDGKSTLLGRLLYDSQLILDDHLEALSRDSRRSGTQGDNLDLALLLDGLAAEREQGITIDVAYRYFSTTLANGDERRFIVADSPGHEQYTRNMVTAASTADLAVLLLDAEKGLLTQTRRHSYLVALLGVRQIVLAVNKMDRVGFREQVFTEIVEAYRDFAKEVGLVSIEAIPLSALLGDNVVVPSDKMPWYQGPTLFAHLTALPIPRHVEGPLRMPVQWVSRPHADFRGYAGQVVQGAVHKGQSIVALPSGQEAEIERIVTFDGDRKTADSGASITVTLNREIDMGRGEILCDAAAPLEVSDQLQAQLIWMGHEPLLPGRSYLLKLGPRTVSATVTALRHKVNVNTLEKQPARTLGLNEIGLCNLSLDRPVAFAAYEQNRELGGFILIDRYTNDTVGAGLIRYALMRADNLHYQTLLVDQKARAALKGQSPCVLWFTGLSGAGKSTIANLVERRLCAMGRHTYLLDGDNVRHGLNRDLGFTDADRVENIRRVTEVAHLMVDAGLIVLVSFISPFRAERQMARERFNPGQFFEIFVDTGLAEAERRDPKGLYQKARRGEIRNFTGIDSPYEPPLSPEVYLRTEELSAEEAAEVVLRKLESR